MTFDHNTSDPMRCRLCYGGLREKFRMRVLSKFDVRYFICSGCGSLQTEPPYWLDEAYSINLSNLDTGAAQRNLENLSAAFLTSRVLKLNDISDFGGGDGLFCRLMRDQGFNCFVNDRYAEPTYAQGFTVPNFQTPQLVTAFEVLEHFACPKADLDAIFLLGARAVLISTEIFSSQDEDWWYYSPESGQHVFFYSEQSLDWIAGKYGYSHFRSGGFILFYKSQETNKFRIKILKNLLRSTPRRLMRSAIAMRKPPGIVRDHIRIKQAQDEQLPG